MKCEYCGGNLSLEALKCPHCGRINKHAQQHVSDMNRYHGEFEETQSDVYAVTHNYAGIAARAAVIVGLLILIVILLVIAGESYSIRSDFMERRADKRYEEYSAIMDQYLAEENYQAFYAFCEREYIEGYDNNYESYTPVLRASRNYKYLYDAIMEFYTNKQNPKAEEYRLESGKENLMNYMENFYDILDMKHYEYYEGADSDKNREILQRMEENVKVLLYTYCNLTEEDLAEWGSMSKAKRIVLLEERIGNAE